MRKFFTLRNLLALVVLTVCNNANAANYYWVGGSGNWSDFAEHWATTSGGNTFETSAPGTVDNVYFDAGSFTGGSATVTVDVTANCQDMDWTGAANAPILNMGSNTLNIYGSLTLVSGMTISGSYYLFQFVANTTGHTITSHGVNYSGGIWFGTPSNSSTPSDAGVGGGWTLEDDLTINPSNNSNSIFFCNGTLNTNNVTITAYTCHADYGGDYILVNAGSSVFNLVQWNGNGNQLNMNAGSTTFNVSGGNFGLGAEFNCNGEPTTNVYGDINFPQNSMEGITLNGGGCTFGNVTNAGGSSIDLQGNGNTFGNFDMSVAGSTIEGSNTFNNLSLSTTGGTYTMGSQFNPFPKAMTETINGSIIGGSGTCASPLVITASSPGATFFKTSGSVTLNYAALTWIIGAGGATFTDNNATDGGNNTGWALTALVAPSDLYWIGGSGNWSDGSHWSATSGGAPFGGCSPLANTNVHFDANSFSSGGTVTLDVNGICNDMNWTGVLHNPTFNGGNNYWSLSVYGSLTLASGMAMTGNCAVQLLATTPGHTITTHGIFSGGLWIGTPNQGSSPPNGGIGGEWTLQDDLTINPGSNGNSNAIYFCNGTLNTNNFTINAYTGHSDYGGDSVQVNAGSSVFNLVTWNGNGSQLYFNGPSTIFNISGDPNNPFNGNSFNCNSEPTSNVYGDVNFTGTGTADFIGDGCTFHNINCPYGAETFSGNNTCNNVVLGSTSSISGSNTFNDLTFSPGVSSSPIYTISAGKTEVLNGSLNISGTADFLTQIISDNGGSYFTFYKASGNVCADYLYLTDSRASGGATFNAGANSQDAGDNTGWVFGSSSTPAGVTISASPSSTICSAGQTIKFKATPTGGGSGLVYIWKVNGQAAGSDTSVYSSNTFTDGDIVTCSITSNSACATGVDTVTSTAINISVGAGGTAGLVSASLDTICNGRSVDLHDTGSVGNIKWQSSFTGTDFNDISGATKTTYTEVASQTTYYRVKTGGMTCIDTSNVFQITVEPLPTASFTYALSDKQASFTSVTSGVTNFNWDFGDNSSSSEPDPTHTYASDATYYVCMDVSNGFNCTLNVCQNVVIGATGVANVTNNENWQVYPDPFGDILTVRLSGLSNNAEQMDIYDVLGRLVFNTQPEIKNNLVQLDLSKLTPGIYYLKVTTDNATHVQQIVKQ